MCRALSNVNHAGREGTCAPKESRFCVEDTSAVKHADVYGAETNGSVGLQTAGVASRAETGSPGREEAEPSEPRRSWAAEPRPVM